MRSLFLVVVIALVRVAPAAAAEGDRPLLRDAAAADRAGAFLPTTIQASVRPGGSMVAFSGVDGRSGGASFSLGADLHVVGPLALQAGVTYLPGRLDNTFQPNIGARVQVAHQAGLGVDLALGVFWRREIITADEGLIEGVVAVGRQAGRFAGLAHLGYGQDAEGDDREGEVGLSGMVNVGERTRLGVDGRLRFDLLSTDSRRAARAEPSFDLRVGPTASIALGPAALLAQVGYAGVRKESMKYQAGLLAIGGVGLAF